MCVGEMEAQGGDDLLMSLTISFVIVAKSCLIRTEDSSDGFYLNQGEGWVAWDTAELSSGSFLPPGQQQMKLTP